MIIRLPISRVILSVHILEATNYVINTKLLVTVFKQGAPNCSLKIGPLKLEFSSQVYLNLTVYRDNKFKMKISYILNLKPYDANLK